MCLQALAATLFGPDRARAILEWETMQGTALLRVGAAVAFAAGGFMAFAVTARRPNGYGSIRANPGAMIADKKTHEKSH